MSSFRFETNERFDRIEERFDRAEGRSAERFDHLIARLDERFDERSDEWKRLLVQAGGGMLVGFLGVIAVLFSVIATKL